jgi:hypothetical protein
MSAQQLVAVAAPSTGADLLARRRRSFPSSSPGRPEANSMRVDMAARGEADDCEDNTVDFGDVRGLLICSCCARG